MTLRVVLAGAWALTVAAPVLWWLRSRRRVDVWRAIPLPAALVGPDGVPVQRSGPPADADLTLTTGLPARGCVVRTTSADGTPVAVTGVPGGGLAVALPPDPTRQRRDALLAELAPRLAHDISTPLTAVTGHLDLLAHERMPARARRSVQICQQEVARICELSRDLLTLTAVRAGAATRRECNAAALAEEAVGALLDEADALGARIVVSTPAERVLVHVSDGDLVRVLRNLAANALRYGLGAHREVRVQVAADADTVRFTVGDDGPGIPPGDLSRLCEPMVRGPATGVAGNGLGLAIAAEVLAAHGSGLEAATTDAGFTVGFRLPRLHRRT